MKHLVPLLFFIGLQGLFAQEYTFQYVDQIKQLKQDQLGHIYLISNKSVCKFDGKESINTCLYVEEQISDVLILSENNYFIAIDQKLLFYQNQKKELEILFEEIITTLALHQNHILIGTLGSGLYSYSLSEKKLIRLYKDSFINDILSLDSYTYILTDDEIIKIDKYFNTVQREKLITLLPKKIINFGHDEMAILMNDGKVIFINPALEIQEIYQAKDFKPKEITGNKGLLFAIDEQHLKQWDGSDFIDIRKGAFEHLVQVQSLLITSHKKSITSQNILSQIYDIDKTFSVFAEGERFWLGREGKISVFQKGKIIKDITFPAPYKNIYVSSLVVNKNKVFAGTMGMGILVFDASSGVLIDTFQEKNTKLSEQNIIQLSLKDKLLWVGYLNGLTAFDLDSKELKYDFTELLNNNYLYGFHVGNPDDFFLGTSDSGLIHVVNGEPSYFLKGSSVYSLVETPLGIIFSAEGRGLYMLQDDSLSKLSDQHFFRSTDIYNMLYVEGNMLFANDFGIDILNLEEQKISYLSNVNLNEPHLNANAYTASNALLGYDNGIIDFNNSLLEEVHNNEVFIKTPLLFNKQINIDETEYNYRDNAWTFEYESKNYYAPNEKYYKYRLIPIEKEWINTTQEKITYYNLPPDDYRFELSSGSHRNFKPTQIKNFEFNIAKPFWLKTWFWILSVSFIVFLTYVIVKYREKQIKKKEKLKSIQLQYEYQRLKDQINPHFLFNSFNSLIGIVEENPEQATQVLEKLSSLFRTILKYEKTEVISLFEELELITQYFEIHKIRFQDLLHLNILNIQDSHKKFVIPFSLQLLLENAIKHNVINARSKLEISISEEDGFLIVSNNLNQKNKNSASLGLGLENLMKRHEMILNKKPVIIKDEYFFTVKIPYIYE